MSVLLTIRVWSQGHRFMQMVISHGNQKIVWLVGCGFLLICPTKKFRRNVACEKIFEKSFNIYFGDYRVKESVII